MPIVNIWWVWKYSEGVEQYTNGKSSTVVSFILLILLGIIGQAIIQASFNQVDGAQLESTPDTPTNNTPEAPTVAEQPSQQVSPVDNINSPTTPADAPAENNSDPSQTPPATPTPPTQLVQ